MSVRCTEAAIWGGPTDAIEALSALYGFAIARACLIEERRLRARR